MAHRSFVEVNNATRLQRSNIIYFDDDLLIDTLDQRISSPAAMDATKLFTQTSLDRSGPRRRVVALAGSCLWAALPISGPLGLHVEAWPTIEASRVARCSDRAIAAEEQTNMIAAPQITALKRTTILDTPDWGAPSGPYLPSGDRRNHAIACQLSAHRGQEIDLDK